MSPGKKRKLRIAKWEKGYEIPWYKKAYYDLMLKMRGSRPRLVEDFTLRASYAKYKQSKALEAGNKEKARKYGRKVMKVKKEAEYVGSKVKKESADLKNLFLAEVMDLSTFINTREADQITREIFEVVRDEESGRISSREADEKILELSGKLVEMAKAKKRS